jgi:predicted transcriptional regulator
MRKFWEKKVTWKKPDEEVKAIAKPVEESVSYTIDSNRADLLKAELDKAYKECDFDKAVIIQRTLKEIEFKLAEIAEIKRGMQALSGYFFTNPSYYGTYNWSISQYTMNKVEWEKLYRTGYGGRHWQEFHLDHKKRSIFVYTDDQNPEFPEDIPYIAETKEIVGHLKNGPIFKFDLVE